MFNLHHAITEIPGILVGHAQDETALTGCTVIICKNGATAGVDQRGGAPGTRETDVLRPLHLVQQIHAIVLSGGSAYGLEAASGVMQFLEEMGVGFDTGVARVPIVPAAVLYDLAIGASDVRPDFKMGYQACKAASSNPPEQGNYGAGTGATAGKLFGMRQSTKSGIGSACIRIESGLLVGALVAANPFGDIVDPMTRMILAGTRGSPDMATSENHFIDTVASMISLSSIPTAGFPSQNNTVIGAVVTNAQMNKEECNKIASMAHNGIALAVQPAHTMYDGDTLFAISTNEISADVNLVGTLSAMVVAQAIVNAVRHAHSAGGIPAMGDLAK